MFDTISFITTQSQKPLSSKKMNDKTVNYGKYNKDAIIHANFSISGSVDYFKKPPISEYALSKLYYMQDFSVFHYKEGSFTERSNYNSYLIAYTYSGNGMLVYKDHTYTLTEGNGFFINCNDYHFYQAKTTGWDVGILHLNGPLCRDFHNLFIQQCPPVFSEHVTGKYQHYLEQLLNLYNNPELNRDWQVSTCIDNMLNHLMKLSFKQTAQRTSMPENIRYLIKYMNSNFTKDLSLDFLAGFCSVNKYHLSREFKKYTGFSPNDYLITLRIEQAKLMLSTTTLPASKIAYEVGFHDQNNFTNQFRRKTNLTPTQYRKLENQNAFDRPEK